MAYLVDSHCHLDFDEFSGQIDAVLMRAREAGVSSFLTISTHYSRTERVLAVAEAHKDVFATIGVHPHHAGEEAEQVDEKILCNLAAHPLVIGLGETGLDYHYNYATPDAQRRSFREHIRASHKTGLPIIIHAREADAEMIEILQEEKIDKGPGGILHCFSSGPELAEAGVKLGLHLSFSGIITFKKSETLREIARKVPLSNLLVETDAPFLAPMPYRGKVNEPAYVIETAKMLSDIKGVSFEELATITSHNFFKLFPKATLPNQSSVTNQQGVSRED